MPLPNHQVIPDGWAAHHRPTADGQMTATGRIEIPASAADATFNETTGRTETDDPTVIYGPGIGRGYRDGRMRVQRLPPGTTNAVAMEVGDREVIMRAYRVSIPLDGPIRPVPIGAIVVVENEGPNGDPDLVGRALHVRGNQVGSLAWQRDLFCEDVGPTTR